jgi:hypothetical protein
VGLCLKMDVSSAADQLPRAPLIGVALAAAAAGGYTTFCASKVIGESTGGRRALYAVLETARTRDSRTRDFWIAASDLGAMTILIALVTFVGFDPTNPIAPLVLMTAILVQGSVAIMAFFTFRSSIRKRRSADDLQQPGERPDSRNVSGGQAVSLQTAEKQPMNRKRPLTRQERARFIERGADIYEKLRPKIEGSHRGMYIAISVNTERFTTTDDDAKLKAFAEKLDPNDFLWMTRVGST